MADWWASLGKVATGVPGNLQATRRKQLTDPYYRFQSAEEVRLAATLGVWIDANQADVDDWLRLPGLSIHQARSLVVLQRSGVQFYCLDDVAAALSLSVQKLQPYAPILRFCYYDPESSCAIQSLDLNAASVEMLSRIPQIDIYLARAIVQQRQSGGRYRSLADLQQRLSLPAALMTHLIHYLRC